MPLDFPCAEWFAQDIGIPAENLIRGYEIERRFHDAVLRETDPLRRKEMYKQVYEAVHPLYQTSMGVTPTDQKDRLVQKLRPELEGKSVLDVGCGSGGFLKAIARHLSHGPLIGIDTSSAVLPQDVDGVRFINSDIIDFDVGRKVDVVFSDNVFEHIAPADVPAHLRSVRNALTAAGTFVVATPNRLFGPSDVTRVLDYSYTGRTPASGSHVNETTYRDLVRALRGAGFRSFTALPPKMGRVPVWVPQLMELPPARGMLKLIRRSGQVWYKLFVLVIARL